MPPLCFAHPPVKNTRIITDRRSTRLLPHGSSCKFIVMEVPADSSDASASIESRLRHVLPRIFQAEQQNNDSSSSGGVRPWTEQRILVVDSAGYATLVPNLNIKVLLLSCPSVCLPCCLSGLSSSHVQTSSPLRTGWSSSPKHAARRSSHPCDLLTNTTGDPRALSSRRSRPTLVYQECLWAPRSITK